MTKSLNDKISLEKITLGNELEFERFFNSRYAQLLRFAMIFIKNREMAEEIVMDIFYKLWTNRKSLITIKNIDTYLFVSVRNLSYSLIKREDKFKFEDLDHLEIDTKAYSYTPENSVITQENLAQINHAIDLLPPKCKLVFKLLREEKLKKKEVAEILNISTKTIDNQMAIAIKKIAEVLQVDLTTRNYSAHIQAYLLFF